MLFQIVMDENESVNSTSLVKTINKTYWLTN